MGQAPEDREQSRSEWDLRRAEFAHWVEGDPERAWRHLQALPESIREEQTLLMFHVQISLEHYEDALEGSRRLLAHHPQNPDALMMHDECLAGMQAWEALAPFLEEFPEATRKRASFWHLKGLSAAHLQDSYVARECLERAAHMDPLKTRFALDAGHACLEGGDYHRAEYHGRQALKLDGRSEEALVHLAEARHAQQDLDGARSFLRECLLHHPGSESAQGFLAELGAN